MAFLALVLQREKSVAQLVFALFFLLMVLWTGSKGPLLGIVFVCLIFFNRIMGSKISTKIMVILLILLLIYILSFFIDDIRSIRSIINFLANPEEYSEGVGKGSIGSRSDFMDISLNLFSKNPITGVGFGGWQDSNTITDHKYPHNIIFEILSETGFIGILLFLILILNLKFKNIIAYIGIFGLVTLLFSGDFSYFRYAFFPLLMARNLIKSNL
jgi:O-antigen ligase